MGLADAIEITDCLSKPMAYRYNYSKFMGFHFITNQDDGYAIWFHE